VTLLQILLWPFAWIYGGIARLRLWCYRKAILRRRQLGKPVISIGNLTMGGTGKTPTVIAMAECLCREGKRVAILTRGYKSRRSGGAGSQPGITANGSDEANLMAARLGDRVRYGIGPDRFATGRKLENWADVFLLDDGFQHLKLARDADILLLDSTNPFGGGHVLPAGSLREPPSSLGRADILLITRATCAPSVEVAVRKYTSAPIFYAETILETIAPLSPATRDSTPTADEKAAKRFFAFCGVGNPKAFFSDLERWQIPVVGRKAFRDHHLFSARDAERIESLAAAAAAEALLCTEKDAYNLACAEAFRLPLYVCRISMRLTDPTGLWQAVRSRLDQSIPVRA
jgi:tetraacyldisaccharide 4'-kinase